MSVHQHPSVGQVLQHNLIASHIKASVSATSTPVQASVQKMSRPRGAFEDGELEISLAPSASRRNANRPPEPHHTQHRGHQNGDHKLAQPAPQKKTEQRIGAYQIIRTLGEGSFGKVKLAVHRITNQQVALKIIARKKLISRDMAGRVEREIEYLQLLRHPHIIKLYV